VKLLLNIDESSQLRWCEDETIGWRIEESSFDFRPGQEIFLFCKWTRPALVPMQFPIQEMQWVISPGDKEPSRGAHQSRLCNAKVENT
jgi:hypothetical protein